MMTKLLYILQIKETCKSSLSLFILLTIIFILATLNLSTVMLNIKDYFLLRKNTFFLKEEQSGAVEACWAHNPPYKEYKTSFLL